MFKHLRSVPIVILLAFALLPGHKLSAQCGIGYTQSQLNWDFLDFLPSNDGNYTAWYTAATRPYNQEFSIGTRRVNFAMAPTGNITLNGENGTNTAHAGSFAAAGQDVQFTTTNAANTTITMTFDTDVSNVNFSLFDLDNNQRVTIAAVNSLAVPQIALITKANILSGITILGQVATAPGTNYGNTNNNGTININVLGPVSTITITLDNATGNIWLGDIDACVTGSFPAGYRNISEPFTGMPAYILTVRNNEFYLLDPSNGRMKSLFTDPGATNMNGMAYDPYKRILYYCYSLTGSPSTTKAIYKYDIDTETISTFVADINAAPLNIPSYDPGVTSGSASFYNGSLYFGVEASNASRTSGRENTVWKIDFAADSITPIRASQEYATRVDSNIAGTDRLIHDWSDIGATNNGMLYDFDGSRGDSMYYHFNMMTGQRTQFLPSGPGNICPRQLAIDWQENVYNMGGLPSGSPLTVGGYIVPYNYDGTVNNAQNQLVNTMPGPVYPTGSWGDCSEAFRPLCDFGDAPSSYDPVALSPAVNERDTAIRIGATWDREWIKTSSASANADGADEDGLSYVPILAPGGGGYVAQLSVYNNKGVPATLVAWLDYNGNNVFDASEAITPITVNSSLSAQNFWLSWPVTTNTFVNGQHTFLRIRISTSVMTSSNATGYYEDGETEDYRVEIDNFPLSVDLVSFNAKVVNKDKAELTWKTVNEENFSGFIIERSADNINWNSIGNINATGNGSADANEYRFDDLRPLTGKSFYRLKLLNGDGKYKYSDTRTITIQKMLYEVTVSPNPAVEKVVVKISSSQIVNATIRIFDMNGKIIYSQNASINRGANSIEIAVVNQINNGMYIIQVQADTEVFKQKLIINKNR